LRTYRHMRLYVLSHVRFLSTRKTSQKTDGRYDKREKENNIFLLFLFDVSLCVIII
jgi:hypothetical protein